MTYNVSSGTLNSTIPYLKTHNLCQLHTLPDIQDAIQHVHHCVLLYTKHHGQFLAPTLYKSFFTLSAWTSVFNQYKSHKSDDPNSSVNHVNIKAKSHQAQNITK